MFNLIGTKPRARRAARPARRALHDYGKAPRPGRKLGHVTRFVTGGRTVRDRVAKQLATPVESPAV